MLSPINETTWSLLPQRLIDIRLLKGQLGANRLLAQHNQSLSTLFFPYSVNLSKSLELLNCFALNDFATSVGTPIEIIITGKEENIHQAISTFSRHFNTEVMSKVISTKSLLDAADKIKHKLLAKNHITQPYSRHLEFQSYLLNRLNKNRKQKLLLLVYESDFELIYLLSKSLLKNLNERIGTIVLNEPQSDVIKLGPPDNKDSFQKSLSRLPSGNETEQKQKITSCEVYKLLFYYGEHHSNSFSAKILDSCLTGETGCKTCKSWCSDYLATKYLNTITASRTPS
ncbi:TPA: hypothetical protein ACF311_004365 [Vibrio parahaemolyticus]|uniref:hypothetical protein n=1 Tax=Vibrio parahaemolyticus TaxID=670 RepID=UPI0011201276|nr:hypothetical protein [Vibrio parahaemolyticus]TOG38620.1 hypothetical protein CGJ02_23810 [Vibrio parahaemolyticus]HBN6205836.1 hypothetical protein [Vibrio parahaemolyticus]HCH4062476.1 hypothetical protein [Vibrio parahaemolyticus]